MSDKFIDKTRLNANRTTNATGLLSAASAIAAAWDGIANARSVAQWLPMVAIGMTSAIAQWLQGEPTPATKLIANVLRLDEGRTNAEFLRDVFDRIFASGVVPGVGSANEGSELNAALLDRMANDGNYGDRGIDNLRNIAPPEIIRSQAWRAADIARGRPPIDDTDIYPSEYAVRSVSGDDGPDGPRSEAW